VRSDILTGMHRSGHHALAIWLFHQKETVNDFSIKTVTSWLFSLFRDQEISLYANNALKTGPNEHPDKKHLPAIVQDNKPAHLLISHEREYLKDVCKIAANTNYGINKPIVVIRDFENWMASCLKMIFRDNKNLDEVIKEDYITMYKDHLENYNSDRYYHINYNKWNRDKEYRSQICSDLGLTFTDAAKNQLSIFGGGSSFDSMQYIRNAEQMRVEERYKEVENDPIFQVIMEKNLKLLDLSNSIFK